MDSKKVIPVDSSASTQCSSHMQPFSCTPVSLPFLLHRHIVSIPSTQPICRPVVLPSNLLPAVSSPWCPDLCPFLCCALQPLSILCRTFQDIDQYTLGFPRGNSHGQTNIFRAARQCLPGPVSDLEAFGLRCLLLISKSHHCMLSSIF